MDEDREPSIGLKMLCFRAVREHFCVLAAHATTVLPCGLLEELQPHLTVCQLDQLQPALNRRGVSTFSGWKHVLRHMRGPSCVLDVCSEDEAKFQVMKGLFSSVLYNFKSDFINKNLSSLNTSSFLGAAAKCIRHFVLLNLEEPLRRLTEEQREVLELLERHVSSVGVSHSLEPSKAENQLALLVLHRLLDHGKVRRVVLQARCPLTLAWILHRRGSQAEDTSEGNNQTSVLCWGPRSSGEEDQEPACKRLRLDYRTGHREDGDGTLHHREGGGENYRANRREDHRRRRLGDGDCGAVGDCLGGRVLPEACRRGHIESLELRQCQVDCLRVLLRALSSWSCLRSLTLHSYASFSQSAVLELSRALQELSRHPGGGVTELSISTLPCPSLLEPLLEACPRLLSLSAEVHSIAGPSEARSPPTPQNHCQVPLQKLSVSLNQQPSHRRLLTSLIRRCPQLCSLHVCGLRLQTGAYYGQLLTTLAGACGSLKSLSLEDVNLSDCLEHVLQLLSRCQLQELSMKDCRLLEKWSNKEESLQRLTTALADHRTLQTLSLAHNRIAKQVPVLAQLFSGASHNVLQRLDLSSNFIQPGELLEFSQRLRALKPSRRITLDLRKNPGDRDPHTWSSAVRSLARCCHLLLEGWTSTNTMVDHISIM